MKKAMLTIIVFATAITALAQTTQPCIVKKYNQKQQKTPLAGVRVRVDGAQTATSGTDGRFTLTFNTLKPGDHVTHPIATKPGYEIFNKAAVEQWFISRNNYPFTLVLVESAYFKQLKGRLTESSQENFRVKYEQAVKELEQLKDQKKLEDREFEKKYNELDSLYQEQLRGLENYVDLFARMDLSEVSEKEEQILALLEEGKIEEAIKAYEELGLVDKLKTVGENYQKLKEAADQQKSDFDNLYESVQRQVAVYLQAEKEEEAKQVLLPLLETLTPLFEKEPNEYRARMAQTQALLGEVSPSDSARNYLLVALREYSILYEQSPELYLPNLSKIQFLLGRNHRDNGKAEEYYLSALENYKQLCQKEPELYEKYPAIILNNLGYRFSESDASKAEHYFLLALEQYTLLVKKNFKKYKGDLTGLYNDMYYFYLENLKDTIKAEQHFQKKVEFAIQRYLQDNSYTGAIRDITHSYQYYLEDFKDITKGDVFFTKQINTYTELCKQEPDNNEYAELLHAWSLALMTLYDIQIIEDEDNFGKDYIEKNRDVLRAKQVESELKHVEVIAFLVDNNHQKWLEMLLTSHIPYGYLLTPEAWEKLNNLRIEKWYTIIQHEPEKVDLIDKSNLSESLRFDEDKANDEKYFLMRIEAYSKLFKQDPKKYRGKLSDFQRHLGDFYLKELNDTINAEKYYLIPIETYSKLFKQDPNEYGIGLSSAQISLGVFYLKELEDTIKAAQHPEAYNAGAAYILRDKGSSYCYHNDYPKAEECYLKAVEIFTQLFNQKPEAYRYYLTKNQYDLGRLYDIYLKDYAKAEEYYLKALENYTQLFTQDPDDYLADMATTEYNLGKLYHHNLLDYSKAEEHYLKALENRTQLFTQNPETYRTDLAWNKYNLGSLYYYHLHNYAKASDYYTGAMELFNLYPERYREDLASTLNMLAYSFAHQKDFSKAIETIDRAIALMPEKANYYDSKGEILLMKGDEQEAVKMWQKVLELDPDFLSKHEDGTDFYKQLKARGLIE